MWRNSFLKVGEWEMCSVDVGDLSIDLKFVGNKNFGVDSRRWKFFGGECRDFKKDGNVNM